MELAATAVALATHTAAMTGCDVANRMTVETLAENRPDSPVCAIHAAATLLTLLALMSDSSWAIVPV